VTAISDHLENELLDHTLNGDTYGLPTAGNVWVALFTDATTDAGGGTELTGGSYARVQMDSSSVNKWNVPAAGLTDNIAAITFPVATASWGTVTNVAICDASSGGNFLYHGAISESKTEGNGDTFEFAAG
jgi:hypothetical protein